MAKRSKTRKMKSLLQQVCHPGAVGIDLGAEEFYAAIGREKVDPSGREPFVRKFSSFNSGIAEAIAWFREYDVKTIAMESTGNYWVALYDQLLQAGFEVCLTNASHCKALPGRKTDICDAQWLQQLHTAGLLRSSYVLGEDFKAIRYIMRYRDGLIKEAASQIQRMQKVFTQMNVQLHHVLSDIDGLSGRTIIEAIIKGQRDPEVLADLRHPGCKTPRKKVIAALSGNFQDEYIFVLAQTYKSWQRQRQDIFAVEEELARLLGECPGAEVAEVEPAPHAETEPAAGETAAEAKQRTYVLKLVKSARKHELGVNFRAEAARIYGIDLCQVPSISDGFVGVLMAEIGGRSEFLECFPTANRFASWLGLCPDNRITGGRVKSAKTRDVKNPLAVALRLAALTLTRAKGFLGEFCRKMMGRLGKAEGITATAHKLARIIYAMLATDQPYDESIGEEAQEKTFERQLAALTRKAAKIGATIVFTKTSEPAA